MIFYTSPIVCAILALIAAFHACSVYLDKLPARIFAYVNIGLHIVLVFLLLYIGAELSEAAVLFMGSFLLYLALSFFRSDKPKDEKSVTGAVEDDI